MSAKKNSAEKATETKKGITKEMQKQAVQELLEQGKKAGELTLGEIS